MLYDSILPGVNLKLVTDTSSQWTPLAICGVEVRFFYPTLPSEPRFLCCLMEEPTSIFFPPLLDCDVECAFLRSTIFFFRCFPLVLWLSPSCIGLELLLYTYLDFGEIDLGNAFRLRLNDQSIIVLVSSSCFILTLKIWQSLVDFHWFVASPSGILEWILMIA